MDWTSGLNIEFPIYKEDGTSFNNLVLRKATVDSIVMSLGDKITGDVYYKDNSLEFSMHEYVVYKDVKYTIVNPPTVVREGLVRDNSELRGMTKYSFEFYHPMYLLNNLPFADVAVSSDETRYLSENKTFSWIGNPDDFIAKLNKNLEGTEWVVIKSDRFPKDKASTLSQVLQFDKNTIGDAMKKAYEEWDIPYVIDSVSETEQYYGQGKRFKVIFGLPSNEIYETDVDRQSGTPFVFKMGQGVGLKNNSRTPRNNKIVTRLSGYGSERNIPYGYPQIVWTGDQSWTDTKNNPNDPTSYPLYKGIVGGRYVKLIKHPFTRTHLMPSIYRDSVNKKVNPFAQGYNPNIELVDYYDAKGDEYPNKINEASPSYEIHEFDTYPRMNDGSANIFIVNAVPLDKDLNPVSNWDDSMDDEGNYIQSYFQITLPRLSFDIYACAAITEEMKVNMRSGACIGCTFDVQVDWEDYKKNFYDSNGDFAPDGTQRDTNKYPKSNEGSIVIVVKKDNTTFGTLMPNIYQNPKSGDEFVVLGISLPNEYIESAERKLDEEMKSYMLENNVYYYDYPLKFDEYFLAAHTNILSQVKTNNIVHFDFSGNVLQLFVKQITIKYGNTPLPQYDITLADNIEVVLNQIGKVADDVEHLGSLISMLRQTKQDDNYSIGLAQKLSKVEDDTAKGLITFLKGLVSRGAVVVNGLLTAYNAVMNTIKSSNYTGDGVVDSGWLLTNDYAGSSRLVVDYLYARKKAVFESLEIKELQFTSGDLAQSLASATIERTDYLQVDEQGEEAILGYSDRKIPWTLKGFLMRLSSRKPYALARNKKVRINLKPDDLQKVNRVRCYFLAKNEEKTIFNLWKVNDLARCQTFNIDNIDRETYAGETHKAGNVYWWRLVKKISTEAVTVDGKDYHYFDVAYGFDAEQKANRTGIRTSWCDILSDLPAAGDKVVQFGNTDSPARMNIIVSEVNGEGNADAPAIKSYRGVHTFNTDDCWWGGESCRKMMLSPSSGVEFYGPSFKFITEYGIERTQVERGAWLAIPFEKDTEHQTFPDYSDDILDKNGNFVSRSDGSAKKYVRKCRYYDNVEHRGSSWRCTIAESHYWRKYNNGVWSKITEAQYQALPQEEKAKCEEVRNYTTDEPSKASNDWTVSAERGQDGSFKSRVFCRTNINIKNANVRGGSYDNPIPTLTKIGDDVVGITWKDGVPQGTEMLWSTVCTFYGDGSNSGWSKPSQETDTETLDIEFSPNAIAPSAPVGTAANRNTQETINARQAQGWYDPSRLPADQQMIYRAECKIKNGVYETKDGNPAWVIARIKGEKGTSVREVKPYYAKQSPESYDGNPPQYGWKESIAALGTIEEGWYVWTKNVISFTDNVASTTTYTVSKWGIDGDGIENIETKFYESANLLTQTQLKNLNESNWVEYNQLALKKGDYIYTRTKITYDKASTPTVSYQVNRIGQDGVGYVGTEEYYCLGDSMTTPPAKHPYQGTNHQPDIISPATMASRMNGGSWSEARPTYDTSTVQSRAKKYLWNFEAGYTTEANEVQITEPICIANYEKGISSIVETYAISASAVAPQTGGYPSDITSWTDEAHDCAPTDAKPYQWNKTVTTYTDGTSDTFYHVSAVKGTRGRGITNTNIYYYANDTKPSTPSGNPSKTDWVDNGNDLITDANADKHLYESTCTTYSDGTYSWTAPIDDGLIKDMAEMSEEFALSDSGTTAPTTGWSTSVAPTAGKWVWSRTVLTFKDGTKKYVSTQCVGYCGIDGKNAVRLDIDNEMDAVQTDSAGVVTAARTVYTVVHLYDGSTEVNISTASLNTDGNKEKSGNGIKVSWSFSVGNTGTDMEKAIKYTYKGVEYSAVFSIVMSRGQAIYQLKPSMSSIPFQRNTDNTLTPDRREVGLSLLKLDGDSTATYTSVQTGLTVRYSTSSMPSSASAGRGWSSGNITVVNTDDNLYIAMFNASGVLLDRETIPVVKDGEKGDTGDDGNGIVSITRTFAISNIGTTVSETSEPSHRGSWTANSPAVTEQYPYLWAKEVVVFTDTTKNTTKYYCIGTRGDNGVDAQDIEWVYIRTKTNTAPVILNDDTYTDSNGKTYTSDDHLPKVSGNTNIENNNSTYQCTDDPKGVTDVWLYEWEIKRTKGAASNGHRSWNYYHGSMTLHNNFAQSAFIIDIDNDNDQFGTDSDSKVLVSQTRSTTVTVYDGATSQTLNSLSVVLTYEDGTSVAPSVATSSANKTTGVVSVTVLQSNTAFSHEAINTTITAEVTGKGTKTAVFTIRKVKSGQPGITPTIYQLNPSNKTFTFNRDASNNLTPPKRTSTINALKYNESGSSDVSLSDSLTFTWGFDEDSQEGSGTVGDTSGTPPHNQISISNTQANAHYQVWVQLSTGDRETLPIVKDGAKGDKGDSVAYDEKHSSIGYAYSSMGTPEAGRDYPSDIMSWSPTPPAVQKGKYLWTKDVTAYNNGGTLVYTTTYGVRYQPKDGESVEIDSSRTFIKYCRQTKSQYTGQHPADSYFSPTYPTYLGQGDYLWILNQVAYVGVTNPLKSYSVSMLGTDGRNGDKGADGYTTHFAYATSADGSQNFSTTNFQGATYIGTYRDQNAADSTNYRDYVWTPWKGDKGNNGKDGWMITANPANVIITQSLDNNTSSFPSATVSFVAKKGSASAVIASIGTPTSSQFNVSKSGNTVVVSSPKTHGSPAEYYTEGSFTVTVNVTDPDTSSTVSFNVTVLCYANLLGSWKQSVEAGEETIAASKIKYVFSASGSSIESIKTDYKSKRNSIGDYETWSKEDNTSEGSKRWMNEHINTAEGNISTVTKKVNGLETSVSQISQTADEIKMSVNRGYRNYILNPKATDAVTGRGTMSEVNDPVMGSVMNVYNSGSGDFQLICEFDDDNRSDLSYKVVTCYAVVKPKSSGAGTIYFGIWSANQHKAGLVVANSTAEGEVSSVFSSESGATVGMVSVGNGWYIIWSSFNARSVFSERKESAGINSVNGSRWLVYGYGIVVGGTCPTLEAILTNTGLRSAGIDISDGTVNLYGDKVTFSDKNGGNTDKIWIDPDKGTLHAVNGKFSGEVTATSGEFTGKVTATNGTIGGFTIDPNRLYNSNWNAGIDINYDSKNVKIGKNAKGVMATEDTIIRAENTKVLGGGYNTALYLNASGATYNYAFYGNGNGVLNGLMCGYKVQLYTIRSGDIDTFSNLYIGYGSTIILNGSHSDGIVWLAAPKLSEVRNCLGINNSTTPFAIEFTVVSHANYGNVCIAFRNVITQTQDSEYPWLMNGDGGRISDGNIQMAQGDVVKILLVYNNVGTTSSPYYEYRAYDLIRRV